MRLIFAFKWAILWAVCILILCIMNPSNLPSIRVKWDIGPDKFVHFTMFAIMSFSLIIGIERLAWQKKFILYAGFLSSIYGVVIEIIQGAFFAHRSFDYADMLANAIGAISISILFFIKSK
jgi:VanZ family protein